jgi:tartrate-resistant acid phosphatase type 5
MRSARASNGLSASLLPAVLAAVSALQVFAALGCAKRPTEPGAEGAAKKVEALRKELPRPSLPPAYTLAVVGDYGTGEPSEAAVAKLVKGWSPSAIVTTGDNIYPHGGGSYDDAIGAYYADYIGSYKGRYGAGSMQNRFWPSPGNHDWAGNEALSGYRTFFTLPDGPGGERYYDVALDPDGLAHLYVLDSDPHEPDGIGADSKQAAWLRAALEANAAKACFHLVAFHHPPYTTQTGHGPATALRWPFKAWGADLVLNGHNHHYERIVVDGLPYVVSGNGGAALYERRGPIASGSEAFDDTHFGALRLGVARGELYGEAFAVAAPAPTDTFLLTKACAK